MMMKGGPRSDAGLDTGAAASKPAAPARTVVKALILAEDASILPRYVAMADALGPRETAVFSTVEDALFWAIANRPNVMLLDDEAPRHVALDFMRRARRSPELESTPIIVFTAHSQRESRRRALALGATEVIDREVDGAEAAARVGALAALLRGLGARERALTELTAKMAHVEGRSQRSFDRLRALHRSAIHTGKRATDLLASTLLAGATTLRDSGHFIGVLSKINRDAVEIVALSTELFDSQNVTRMPRVGDRRNLAGSLEAMIAAAGDVVSWDDLAGEHATARIFAVMELNLRSAIGCAFAVERERYVLYFASRRGVTAHPFDDDDRSYVELLGGMFSMLIRQAQQASHIIYQAERDGLTGLYNRNALRERLAERTVEDTIAPFAVMFFDLDHFKEINDSLGHPVGDMVLMEIANRLQSVAGENDMVARMGGDEFAFMVDRFEDANTLRELARKCMRLIERQIVREDLVLQIGTSIGVSVFPEDGSTVAELLSHADAALYEAKRAGRSTVSLFDKSVSERLERRRTLQIELREALERKQFVLFYQPEIDLATGAIVGLEALIRWKHPTRGIVGPGEFIPFAEETGFIRKIGAWVIEQACMQAPRLLRGRDARVFVNLSAAQLNGDTVVDEIESLFGRYGVPPGMLGFEITETMAMSDPEMTLHIVERLRALGARVAIDDFGTGYSSLAYLKTLRPDTIKIDRTFTKGLPDDEGDRAIVETVVLFAQKTGRRVLAEGIETAEQEAWLSANGIHEGQGYRISPPLPAEELTRWMRRWDVAPEHIAKTRAGRLGIVADVSA